MTPEKKWPRSGVRGAAWKNQDDAALDPAGAAAGAAAGEDAAHALAAQPPEAQGEEGALLSAGAAEEALAASFWVVQFLVPWAESFLREPYSVTYQPPPLRAKLVCDMMRFESPLHMGHA